GRVVGQPLQSGAVGADPPDVRRALPVRGEHDPCAVGRERRVVVVLTVGHERLGVLPVRVGHEEVRVPRAEVREGDGVTWLRLLGSTPDSDTRREPGNQGEEESRTVSSHDSCSLWKRLQRVTLPPNVRHERRPKGAAFWTSARWRGYVRAMGPDL